MHLNKSMPVVIAPLIDCFVALVKFDVWLWHRPNLIHSKPSFLSLGVIIFAEVFGWLVYLSPI